MPRASADRVAPSARSMARAVGAVALATVVSLAACAAPQPVVVYEPAIDAAQTALRLEVAENLEAPERVVFDWSIAERGIRVSGRGVARMEPPYKARLDLFLGNSEPAGRAALVGDSIRLPAVLPPSVLPPPHLLWGTLGVFRPGFGTLLLGAEREGDELRLRYRLENGDEVIYRTEQSRIVGVDVLRAGTLVQQVTLVRDALGVPAEAVFRDLVDVRELKLVRTSVERTAPFPADIWFP